jgi:hypothetical protein
MIPAVASTRFWLESALATVSALLAVVTVFWHEWIELGFRVDPDGGSGAAEWLVVALLGIISAVSALAARVEWRRLAAGASA